MIFIFGYHPITNTVGPVEEKECPNCHNTRHWLLGKMTYYINLFFVPVIPTKTDHYKYCPICKFRQEITKEDYKSSKELADLNNEAVHNDMTEEEYSKKLRKIHH